MRFHFPWKQTGPKHFKSGVTASTKIPTLVWHLTPDVGAETILS